MKNTNEINKETYDIISSDWNLKRQYFWKPVNDFLNAFENKSNLKLLDLGCGTARHLELTVKLGFDKENIIGCDFSEGQLKIVKEKGFNTKVCDMINLDFEKESFDIIICIAAHHHLLDKKDQLKALEQMRRILKKDGEILLCNWFPEKKFLEEQLKKKKFEYIDDDQKEVKVTYTFENKKHNRYYYLFEKKELESLCKEAKFKIISSQIFEGNIYLTIKLD